ncbi:MAG: carbamoyltransferase HypF [Gammaproteobacteria bacterium]
MSAIRFDEKRTMSGVPALARQKHQGSQIRVRGLVQGVGFRPTVWRLATDCGISGEVLNDSDGVLIRAWGNSAAIEVFIRRLKAEAPPLARIDTIERGPLGGRCSADGFRIAASTYGEVHTGVVPDAATCAACVEETLEPLSRRYHYPFTNCTHCGPRLSIVNAIPYDRGSTSMAMFDLCDACQVEYDDPADRRFHAQPIACPVCGPKVSLEHADGTPIVLVGDPIEAARRLLLEGNIIAIKGLGGFHLACDATNPDAVTGLRARKRRYHKAFALMASDARVIQRYCTLSSEELALLATPAAPIVLCAANGPKRLPDAVASGLNTLGFMLPYTPLHHLLVEGLDRPIVLTSGNVSDEPQCIGNQQARERLRGIADYLLLHDRDIVNRVDDSVLRIMDGAPRILRRGRGYAPASIPLPPGFERATSILALGGELKNTFCLIKDGQAIISQHQGDLEDAATYRDYQRNLELYRGLFEHEPQTLAADRHPEYLSTKLGKEWSARDALPLVEVQHHHAHIASCLADNDVPLDAPPVLGVALDGSGFGDDGTFWGGEFLLAGYCSFERLASFKPVAMIGGAQAMREPWRNTYAHLVATLGWTEYQKDYGALELTRFLESKPLATFEAMLKQGLNCPPASSCGRLFDAVAAAIGVCREQASYEGQAAIELEALAQPFRQVAEEDAYPFRIEDSGRFPYLEPEPMWRLLLGDLSAHTTPAVMAARFHKGLARGVVAMVSRLSKRAVRKPTIALSGGVFQNKTLLEEIARRLRAQSFTVLTQRQVPANDGGLSLGQAAIAAAQALTLGGVRCV